MVTEPAQPAPPLDMQRFLGVVRRRAVSIVGVTLVVVALALAVTLVRSARYASGVQVEVRPLTLEELPFSGTADVNMETEAARVTQGPVAVRAAEMLGIGRSSLEQAVQGVDVTVRPNTTFLDISCSRQTPEAAQTCANAFAVAYVDDRVEQADALIQARIDASNQRIAEAGARVRELKQRLAGASPREQRLLRAQIDQLEDEIAEAVATMVSLPTANPSAAVISGSAELPRGPANKNYLFVIAIATMIGLVLGVGIGAVPRAVGGTGRGSLRVRGRSRRTRPRGRPRCSPTPSSCTGARQPRSSRRAGCRGVPGRSNRAAPPLAR